MEKACFLDGCKRGTGRETLSGAAWQGVVEEEGESPPMEAAARRGGLPPIAEAPEGL